MSEGALITQSPLEAFILGKTRSDRGVERETESKSGRHGHYFVDAAGLLGGRALNSLVVQQSYAVDTVADERCLHSGH